MTIHRKLSHLWNSSLVANGIEVTHRLIEEIYSCTRNGGAIHDLGTWGLSQLAENRHVVLGSFNYN